MDTTTITTSKTDKEIKLELIQIASAMANTQWVEANNRIKFEAEKSGKTEYQLMPDNRLKQTILIAKRLHRFIDTTGDIDGINTFAISALSAN